MKKLLPVLFLLLSLFSIEAGEQLNIIHYFSRLGTITDFQYDSSTKFFSDDLAYESNAWMLNGEITICIMKEYEDGWADIILGVVYGMSLEIIKNDDSGENFRVIMLKNGNLSMLVVGIDRANIFAKISSVFKSIP